MKLEELIGEIRRLPGFEDLWTALTEAEAFEAAKYGPNVVINVSRARAIMRGRQKDLSSSCSSKAVPRALLVGMQHTPDSGSLPYANKEIEVVPKTCESAGLKIIQPRPCKEEVSKCLLDYTMFHFAGHGYTDENDPSNIHLRLEDWKEDPFRFADLQRMNLREPAPLLAYLSAVASGR
ncbi:hypothetical protein FCOIX_1602 [Fusarium coicis]|nr:hypothetical protein FCOIX_1602 [Fusarium coicis]